MSFRGGLYKYNVSTREFVNFTRKKVKFREI